MHYVNSSIFTQILIPIILMTKVSYSFISVSNDLVTLDYIVESTDVLSESFTPYARIEIPVETQNYQNRFFRIRDHISAPIILSSDSLITGFQTIQSAIDHASSGDTIFINEGIYVEDINLNKEGITLVGSGSGAWNGTAGVGGTIIKGAFRWINTALNCKLKSVGLTTNNPSNDTAYNLSFMGSSQSSAINFNCYIDDVAFYGDGFCTHNTEFRGKKWFVTNVRSYNAGIHNFPIKAADSVFRNIYVDNNGVSNSSCIIFKSHLTTGNYGSPNNTILDEFKIVASGNSYYPIILFANQNEDNESIVNAQIKNGYVENNTENSIPCIRLKGGTKTNHFIKNITIDSVVTRGGKSGVEILEGSANTVNKGIEGVFIRNCTFLDPTGPTSSQYAINNLVHNDPASGVVAGNLIVRGYPIGNFIKESTTVGTIQKNGIFEIQP